SHEAMITEDDARKTLEFDTYYVIQPEFPWWGAEDAQGGTSLPDGFRYSSETNSWWLTIEELQELVGE
ncbi:MAG: UDP-N-acetylglucosamine 4,6-dehydratase (inverting), partial [Desulfitobacterium hafniense]|nr:UDP-N-acetylglucosamine 4,6-dehydratase (inverting) [Desulfitobacterium hafniense]